MNFQLVRCILYITDCWVSSEFSREAGSGKRISYRVYRILYFVWRGSDQLSVVDGQSGLVIHWAPTMDGSRKLTTWGRRRGWAGLCCSRSVSLPLLAYYSVTCDLRSSHAEPKAKHLGFAVEISAFGGQILRCAQNDKESLRRRPELVEGMTLCLLR